MIYYKYLHPDRADVLENLKIRYTQVSALNDPFESLPGLVDQDQDWYWQRFKSVISTEMDRQGIKGESKRKQYFRSRKKDFNNFYRCYTDAKYLSQLSEDVQKMSSTVQACLSLSGTQKNILMWSHYARNHEGFVIGFDGDHDYFGKRVNPVTYTNIRPFVDPTTSRQSGELFYTKSKDWEYEQEYRKFESLVPSLPLKNGNSFSPFYESDLKKPETKEVFLFDLPKEAVVSVIFGWKSAPELKERIISALSKNRMGFVKLYQAIPHKTKFEMEIENSEMQDVAEL